MTIQRICYKIVMSPPDYYSVKNWQANDPPRHDQFSTGIAYLDVYTGLFLLYETSNGFVTVFFPLSAINYNFTNQTAYAEDIGPQHWIQVICPRDTSLQGNLQSRAAR
jgi:hypothetical protein